MNGKIIYSVFGAIAVGAFWWLSTFFTPKTTVAVVDSQKVLEGYQGFKEARDAYEIRIEELTKGFNDRRKIFETKKREHEVLKPERSPEQHAQQEENLSKMQQELIVLGTQLEEQSAKEEEKLLKGVYNKINDFMGRYGKEKGYDVILGANGQGNVMYTDHGTDVTDEVLKALNKEYVNGI